MLKLSRRPCCRWLAGPVTEAEGEEAHRADALLDAHQDDPSVRLPVPRRGSRDRRPVDVRADGVADLPGQPLVVGVREEAGEELRKSRLLRCTTISWSGTSLSARRTSCGRPTSPSSGIQAAEAKLCGRAIKDVFSGRIAGYSIDSPTPARLAVQALINVVARRGDVAGCIVHSDRGSQVRARRLVHALNRHGPVGSAGEVGAAGDNAAMESFFALLQRDVLDRRSWSTRNELRIAIVTWTERTYHRRRGQARLSRLTPHRVRDHDEVRRDSRGMKP